MLSPIHAGARVMRLKKWVPFTFVLVGLSLFIWGYVVFSRHWSETAPQPQTEYSSFKVRVADNQVMIQNIGPDVLTQVRIEFEADFDLGLYTGTQNFDQWECGHDVVVDIVPPRELGRIKSFRFTGWSLAMARRSSKNLTFSMTFDPPVKMIFGTSGGKVSRGEAPLGHGQRS
jgi:hypothetical protein